MNEISILKKLNLI